MNKTNSSLVFSGQSVGVINRHHPNGKFLSIEFLVFTMRKVQCAATVVITVLVGMSMVACAPVSVRTTSETKTDINKVYVACKVAVDSYNSKLDPLYNNPTAEAIGKAVGPLWALTNIGKPSKDLKKMMRITSEDPATYKLNIWQEQMPGYYYTLSVRLVQSDQKVLVETATDFEKDERREGGMSQGGGSTRQIADDFLNELRRFVPDLVVPQPSS
jgi:hypothetical protein